MLCVVAHIDIREDSLVESELRDSNTVDGKTCHVYMCAHVHVLYVYKYMYVCTCMFACVYVYVCTCMLWYIYHCLHHALYIAGTQTMLTFPFAYDLERLLGEK